MSGLGTSIADHIGRFAENTPGALAAIDDQGGALDYAALIARADLLLGEIGPERRLVLLEGGATVDWLVAYVAALRGRHPVLIAPADSPATVQRLKDTFAPSVVMMASDRFQPQPATNAANAGMHADLALLLLTSGSTGSAKCVRLSHANLDTNAASIGDYLGLGPDERGVVSLPTHYSYGLSIVNSHLRAGATSLLTRRSLIDSDFWSFCAAHGATSFAGVPHSYDLLTRLDLAAQAPATLRYFTQAGGRLATDQAAHFEALARQHGWRFYVMYGQTEATARMAYVPPAELRRKPGSIGIAIPGGRFRLEAADGTAIDTADTVGELLYDGGNVMMGYAMSPADLAAPAGPATLRTGDLAARDGEGFFRITGRLSRFVKIFGNRIGLDDVERLLAEQGHHTIASGVDDHLLVVTRDVAAVARIPTVLRTQLKLPDHAMTVRLVDDYPVLPSGKIDYAGLKASIAKPAERDPIHMADGPAGVRAAFALVFGTLAGDEAASFASLGGDSLTYMQVAIGLESVLDDLPADWTHQSIGALAALAQSRVATPHRTMRRTMLTNLDTLRAVACMLVVMYHVVGSGPENGLHLPAGSLAHYVVNGLHPVRMPLFVAMAGFLYAAMPVGLTGIGPFLARKVRLLLIPMLVVGLLSWAARAANQGAADDLPTVFLHGYLHLWFIYALMIIFTVVAIIDTYVGTSARLWMVLTVGAMGLAAILPFIWLFSISFAAGLLPFFMIGVAIYRRPDLIRSRPLLVGAAIAAPAMLTITQFVLWGFPTPPGMLLLSFAGGAGFVLLALRFFPRIARLEWLGAFSFTIYLWHPTANAAVRGGLVALGVVHPFFLFTSGLAAGILLPVCFQKLVGYGPRWLGLALAGR